MVDVGPVWGFDVKIWPSAKLRGNLATLLEGVVLDGVVEVWLGFDFDLSWHVHMALRLVEVFRAKVVHLHRNLVDLLLRCFNFQQSQLRY